MSSFRVERQNVSFQSLAEPMQEQLAKEARETEDLLVFGMMGKMQEARNDPA